MELIRQGAIDRCEVFAGAEEGGSHPNPTFPGIQRKKQYLKWQCLDADERLPRCML